MVPEVHIYIIWYTTYDIDPNIELYIYRKVCGLVIKAAFYSLDYVIDDA